MVLILRPDSGNSAFNLDENRSRHFMCDATEKTGFSVNSTGCCFLWQFCRYLSPCLVSVSVTSWVSQWWERVDPFLFHLPLDNQCRNFCCVLPWWADTCRGVKCCLSTCNIQSVIDLGHCARPGKSVELPRAKLIISSLALRCQILQ